MPKFLALGDWPRGRVRLSWTASTRRILPDVEQIIESAWSNAARRLGTKLFDGPMCRLERFAASDDSLELFVSPTSYKPFLGTDLTHAHDIVRRKPVSRDGVADARRGCGGGVRFRGRRRAEPRWNPSQRGQEYRESERFGSHDHVSIG